MCLRGRQHFTHHCQQLISHPATMRSKRKVTNNLNAFTTCKCSRISICATPWSLVKGCKIEVLLELEGAEGRAWGRGGGALIAHFDTQSALI